MPSPIVEEHLPRVYSPAEPLDSAQAETLLRQKMRLHVTRLRDKVTRDLGLLSNAARTVGRYAGLASRFSRQLIARRKP